MRLLEIASAEEQIALFKLVSDSVWAALTTQQQQQAEEEAAKKAAAKAKPKVKRSLAAKLTPHIQPKPFPTSQHQLPAAATQPTTQPFQSVQNPSKSTEKDALTAAIKANGQQQRQA